MSHRDGTGLCGRRLKAGVDHLISPPTLNKWPTLGKGNHLVPSLSKHRVETKLSVCLTMQTFLSRRLERENRLGIDTHVWTWSGQHIRVGPRLFLCLSDHTDLENICQSSFHPPSIIHRTNYTYFATRQNRMRILNKHILFGYSAWLFKACHNVDGAPTFTYILYLCIDSG